MAFEPLDVGVDFYAGVAFELIRVAEGESTWSKPQRLRPRPLPVLSRLRFAEADLPDLPVVLCGVADEDAVVTRSAQWRPPARSTARTS